MHDVDLLRPPSSFESVHPRDMVKRSPVIAITGTPGTGKSTHAQLLVQESPIPLKHINVGELVKMEGLHEGFDEEWQSYTVDEDKVCFRSIGQWSSHTLAFLFSFVPLVIGHSRTVFQLLDVLEPIVSRGGVVLDWHTCGIYPERWPDLVVVLRCNHTKLWDRLEKRCVSCCCHHALPRSLVILGG